MADDDECPVGWRDPAAIGTTREFGAALTQLRDRAGLSVRQVAQAVGVPRTTIGDYFAGKSLPGAATSWVLPRILEVCGVSEPDLVEPWRQALIRVRRTPGPARGDAPVPYRGLEAFQPEDAEWFHGRDRLIRTIVDHIDARRAGGGLLFVVGQSGAGKSSLLRAGVIPALDGDPTSHNGAGPGTGRAWGLLTPGADPVPRLDECLADTSDGGLVIVDQFEELFTTTAAGERAAFVARLGDLVGTQVLVVLAMRSDFYDQAIQYPILAEGLQLPTVVVGSMSPEELRAVIALPARRAGVELEDGLVELVLRDFRPVGSDRPLPTTAPCRCCRTSCWPPGRPAIGAGSPPPGIWPPVG